MPRPSRNLVLALIGITLVLHTIEEYLTFPRFLATPGRLPRWLPPPHLLQDPRNLHIALAMAAVLPLVVIVWAMIRPAKVLLILSLLVESVLLVNAGWHMSAALVTQGYVPGLITAVAINLPFGIFALRTAAKQRWVSMRTIWQLIGVAFVLHVAALGTLLG